MYCTHCGKEIPDSGKFCPYCGGTQKANTEQESEAPQQLEQPQPERLDQPEPEQMQQPTPVKPVQQSTPVEPMQQSASEADTKPGRKKGGAGKAIVLLLVVAIVAVAAFVLIKNYKKTVNLSDYLEITFTGYDGYGSAAYTLDTESEPIAELGLDWSACELTPTEGLSNTDTVMFCWNIPEEELETAEKASGCKITAEDVTVAVEGLEAVATFDAFDGVELTFSGTEPEGTAVIASVGKDETCRELDYRIDPDVGLSNGDTVTVTVGDVDRTDWVTALIEQYGKAPAETSQTYTVEGLNYYATSASEIPEDTLQQMQMRAKEAFLDRGLDQTGDAGKQTMTGYEYIGTYFLSAKDASADDHNKVYLVYKYRMHLVASSMRNRYDENVDAYWACEFDNVLITADGSCKVDVQAFHEIDGDKIEINSGVAKDWASNRIFRFNGYQDLETMYKDLVTAQADRYTSENNVKDVELVIADEEEDPEVLLPYEADTVDDVSANYDDYETAIRYRSGNGGKLAYTKYWLKGQYDTLTFTVLPVNTDTWWGNQADLYVTNAETGEILTSIEVGPKDIPREYTVDISGVDALAISNQRHGYIAYLLVADATVTTASGESATLQYDGNIPADLPESEDHGDAVSLSPWGTYADTNFSRPDPTTIWGTDTLYIWSNLIALNPGSGGKEAKVIYDLDHDYTTLTFEYSPASGDSYDDNGSVTLNVVNEETGGVLYTADITKSTQITDATVDVTGVKYLAIEVNRKLDYLYNKVLINNAYLTSVAD